MLNFSPCSVFGRSLLWPDFVPLLLSHLKFNVMENNQPTNKIDSITQFLTVHNTTIIAIIMAISAMLGQNYQQNEEAVFEDQENYEDTNAYMDELNLEYLGDSISVEEQQKLDSIRIEYEKEQDSLLADATGLDVTEVQNLTEEQEEAKIKEAAETAETQSAYSDYATTILQVSVLLSSIGVSVVNKLLSYLASGLTLVGVVLGILAAAM